MWNSKREKKDYTTAVIAELVAHHAMSFREAKRTVRKSYLKKALHLYPEVQLHDSVQKAARDIVEYCQG